MANTGIDRRQRSHRMHARARQAAIGLALGGLLATVPASAQPDTQRPADYQTPRWDRATLGNHRFAIDVASAADIVKVDVPWRRRGPDPAQVAVIVTDSTGKRIDNTWRKSVDREHGQFAFQPAAGTGRYYLYYLPYTQGGRENYPTVTYVAPQASADTAWRARAQRDWASLPQASVAGYEAVTPLDAFTDMEFIASAAETAALMQQHPQQRWLLFPETRRHPVRMFDAIPQRWATAGPSQRFSDSAKRGESLAFQLGVWAARAPLQQVRVRFDGLQGPGAARIPASALHSFNTAGTAYTGQPLQIGLDVAKGRVQPLWFALDVPEQATPGKYSGTLTVESRDGGKREVALDIDVAAATVAAHGDDAPADFTRLRWLDSTLAQDDTVVKPYTPVKIAGRQLDILGRDLQLGEDGLPTQVHSRFSERMTEADAPPRELLAAPIRLLAVDKAGEHAAADASLSPIRQVGPGKVEWTSESRLGGLRQQLKASFEFDGSAEYSIALTAARDIALDDIRMEIPLRADVAKYLVGLGRPGARVPDRFDWTWDVKRNQDGAWLGDVNAGLQFQLRDEHYSRPLNTNFYHDKPLLMPTSWDNGGKGGIRLRRDGGRYLVTAFSGPRTLKKGQVLHYDVHFRLTPFKPIQPAAQFDERFFHKYAPLDQVQAAGANVVNVHHATAINPWINYPFLEPTAMRRYIDDAHKRNIRVKIYDTVRELSNHAPETPMLESLGHEIYSAGKGGGYSWLQEHLDGDYIAAWYVPTIQDAAVINSGMNRWHNYYIEGLDWLARNMAIDGLYLDDVAFDRVTMKRVRKVLQAHRPDPIIDLHSANQFNERDGWNSSALLYMEHMPFLDRLWFGEYFDYDSAPDYWLTEISGVPFGLMGEMLQGDGNPWRGMLFGMTSRLGWSDNSDPRPLWTLWDRFGIDKAQMIGWWVHDTPVKTDRDDVLATSYVRDGKTLVAIASWAKTPVTVQLRLDGKQLGVDPARVRISAPAVANFQPARTFKAGEGIPVEPGKGWLLEIGASDRTARDRVGKDAQAAQRP